MMYGVVAVLVLGILVVGTAAGQSLPHIQMSTDSDVYGPGETIFLNGLVERESGGAVTILVVSPGGNVVAVGQVMPDGRDWSWSLPAEFDKPGTYTIFAHYTLAGDPEKRAAVSFVYDAAVRGMVHVNGTVHDISYTGDPVLAAHTDAHNALMYLEFDGPAAGVMRLPDGLHEGVLVAVEGGSVTALPDGSYAYSTDSDTLVLAADAVAVPEFGMVAILVSALAVSAALPLARRLHH